MKFEYKKCNDNFEFLYLKNKYSGLFRLCDDCYEKEVKKANSH